MTPLWWAPTATRMHSLINRTPLSAGQNINAGFHFAECHFPYETPANDVRQSLQDTGVKMLCLKTTLGANGQENFGVAPRVGRECEAQDGIDEALAYAATVGSPNINVVRGKTGRGEPDSGEIDYPWLLKKFATLGWRGCVGAEYQPRTTTETGLGWMSAHS